MLDCIFVCELAECHYLCVVKRNLRASFGFLNQLASLGTRVRVNRAVEKKKRKKMEFLMRKRVQCD